MGCCSSCLRVILEADADVKIHVIEPTSIAVDQTSSSSQPSSRPPEPSGPTLQVPSLGRPRRESTST